MTKVSGASEQDAPTPTSTVPARGQRIEATIVALIIIGIAIGGLILASTIRESGSALTLSPRVAPYAVCGLLLVSGIGVFVGQLRGKYGQADEGEDVDVERGTSWITTIIIASAFLSLVLTIPWLGWPLGVMITFAGSAIALGAKKWWIAVLVGLALGAITQLLFGTLLGLSLPITGTLTSWIPLG